MAYKESHSNDSSPQLGPWAMAWGTFSHIKLTGDYMLDPCREGNPSFKKCVWSNGPQMVNQPNDYKQIASSLGRIQVLVPQVLFLRTPHGFEDNTPNCQWLVSGNHLLPHQHIHFQNLSHTWRADRLRAWFSSDSMRASSTNIWK